MPAGRRPVIPRPPPRAPSSRHGLRREPAQGLASQPVDRGDVAGPGGADHPGPVTLVRYLSRNASAGMTIWLASTVRSPA